MAPNDTDGDGIPGSGRQGGRDRFMDDGDGPPGSGGRPRTRGELRERVADRAGEDFSREDVELTRDVPGDRRAAITESAKVREAREAVLREAEGDFTTEDVKVSVDDQGNVSARLKEEAVRRETRERAAQRYPGISPEQLRGQVRLEEGRAELPGDAIQQARREVIEEERKKQVDRVAEEFGGDLGEGTNVQDLELSTSENYGGEALVLGRNIEARSGKRFGETEDAGTTALGGKELSFGRSSKNLASGVPESGRIEQGKIQTLVIPEDVGVSSEDGSIQSVEDLRERGVSVIRADPDAFESQLQDAQRAFEQNLAERGQLGNLIDQRAAARDRATEGVQTGTVTARVQPGGRVEADVVPGSREGERAAAKQEARAEAAAEAGPEFSADDITIEDGRARLDEAAVEREEAEARQEAREAAVRRLEEQVGRDLDPTETQIVSRVEDGERVVEARLSSGERAEVAAEQIASSSDLIDNPAEVDSDDVRRTVERGPEGEPRATVSLSDEGKREAFAAEAGADVSPADVELTEDQVRLDDDAVRREAREQVLRDAPDGVTREDVQVDVVERPGPGMETTNRRVEASLTGDAAEAVARRRATEAAAEQVEGVEADELDPADVRLEDGRAVVPPSEVREALAEGTPVADADDLDRGRFADQLPEEAIGVDPSEVRAEESVEAEPVESETEDRPPNRVAATPAGDTSGLFGFDDAVEPVAGPLDENVAGSDLSPLREGDKIAQVSTAVTRPFVREAEAAEDEIAPSARMSLKEPEAIAARAEKEAKIAARAETATERIGQGEVPTLGQAGALTFQGGEIAERGLINIGEGVEESVPAVGPSLPGTDVAVSKSVAGAGNIAVQGAGAAFGNVARLPASAGYDLQQTEPTPTEIEGTVSATENTAVSFGKAVAERPYSNALLFALPAAEGTAAGVRGYRTTARSKATVPESAISGESPMPRFETSPGSPTSRALAEVQRRAADNPPAVTEPLGTEGALFHSTTTNFGRSFRVGEGASELPGIFTSPDASKIGLRNTVTESSRSPSFFEQIKPTRPDLRTKPDRFTGFQGDRIRAMPEDATGAGYEVRRPGGEVVDRGLGRGQAKSLAEDVPASEVRPDATTRGYEFLSERADTGSAYVRPQGSRTPELEAIIPPKSQFGRAGRVAVELESGRKVPLDLYRRAGETATETSQAGETGASGGAGPKTAAEIASETSSRAPSRQGTSVGTYGAGTTAATAAPPRPNTPATEATSTTETSTVPTSTPPAISFPSTPGLTDTTTEPTEVSDPTRPETTDPTRTPSASEPAPTSSGTPFEELSRFAESLERSQPSETTSRPPSSGSSPPPSGISSPPPTEITSPPPSSPPSRPPSSPPPEPPSEPPSRVPGIQIPTDPGAPSRPKDGERQRDAPEQDDREQIPFDIPFTNPIATGREVLFGF